MTDTLQSFNPRTGQVRAQIPTTPLEEISHIIEKARKIAPEWAAIDPEGRARMMREVRINLYNHVDEIVDTIYEETGKPRFEALAYDVMPSLLMLFYFERTAPKALRPQRVGRIMGPIAGVSSRIEWRPFGVVGAITPWNYPLTNSFLAFAPALFAGNAVVIKPSEATPACGELIRTILDPLPPSVATVIQGGPDIGAALVDAPCDKISFIGSPATGRKICEAAARTLTPVVMELGGKDAAVVCEDADIDRAAAGIAWGAFFNCGQTCSSLERVYVVDSVADRFEERLIDNVRRIRQGEDVGPLTFKPQLGIVQSQVTGALQKGARLLSGGPEAGTPNKDGSLWFAPTVVTDLNTDMDVLTKESFGPVLSYVRVQDEDEGIRRANEDAVNLTASVWTRDKRKADRLSARLRAGVVTVNMHGESAGSPWGPWGGVGESGFGRLNGTLGVREFTVPVHVQQAATSLGGRLWWYPHDEDTNTAMRAIVDFLGSPKVADKVAATKTLASTALRAMKAKF